MTPSQLDHLRRIDANLAKLLSLAEKRTAGEWEHCQQSVWVNNEGSWINCPNLYANAEHNAAFIASCAGNAEAGWSNLRDEIADLIAFNNNCRGWKDDNGCAGAAIQYIQLRMARILAAFPLEMLTP